MSDAKLGDRPAKAENRGAPLQPDLYVQWSADDKDWSVDSSPSQHPKKKLKPLVFEPESGQKDIIFELRPPQGESWTFRDESKGGPISSADDCGCPPPAGGKSSQIVDPRISAGGTVLTVTNKNEGAARLVRYMLHIEDAPQATCDPAILNGGSGNH